MRINLKEIMNKKILLLPILVLSFSNAFSMFDKAKWAWVNWQYEDKSKEGNQACGEIGRMLKELSRPSTHPVIENLKEKLIEHLEKGEQLCDLRDRAYNLQLVEKNPTREKYLRLGDEALLEDFKETKQYYGALQVAIDIHEKTINSNQ